jgi:hypothetical protein
MLDSGSHIVVALLGLTFVAVPAIVVQVFLIHFWVVEPIFWPVATGVRQTDRPPPSIQPRTT